MLEVEARDIDGAGPYADQAEIIIEIKSINSYRPVFIMPALTNASVELQEVYEPLLWNANLPTKYVCSVRLEFGNGQLFGNDSKGCRQ